MQKKKVIFLILILNFLCGFSQDDVNYDESKVQEYNLPELLITQDGKKIPNTEDWLQTRRPEILSLFEEHMYDKIPGTIELSSSEVIEKSERALEGKALRKQVLLTFKKNGKELKINLLIFLPVNKNKPPVFLGYNFFGNHTVSNDPEILIPTGWSRNSEKFNVYDHQPKKESRGAAASRWPLKEIIDAGYGLATKYYGDVDPDKYGAVGIDFSDGVDPLLDKSNQTEPLPDEWGGISALAWDLIRKDDCNPFKLIC